MKANEFFKAMGLKAVKQFLENDNIRTKEMSDDLKRLIESHELVEKVGGLLNAKANINEMVVDSGSGYVSDGAKLYDYDFSFGSLRKAIADVESCMEMPSESN